MKTIGRTHGTPVVRLDTDAEVEAALRAMKENNPHHPATSLQPGPPITEDKIRAQLRKSS